MWHDHHKLDSTETVRPETVMFICKKKNQGIEVADHFNPEYCPYCSESRSLVKSNEPLWIRNLQENNEAWFQETIPHYTPLDQAAHTVNEASELLDLYVKQSQYQKDFPKEEAMTEAGDIVISLLSFMSIEEFDVVECIQKALQKNDSRDWDEHMESDES